MSKSEIQSGPAFPIAVGGVGGSGTRVVANILGELGYYLGGDLNESVDNLWYTLLFKRRAVLQSSEEQLRRLTRIFTSAMAGRRCNGAEELEIIEMLAREERYGHDSSWLAMRSESLRAALQRARPFERWAWKEPNTHVLIDRLADFIPALRYVHVVRDGLDMAFSKNKNQLHYWADSVFGMTGFDPQEPAAALRYWRLVNERIGRLQETGTLPILEVGFECLCESPAERIFDIAAFCDMDISTEAAAAIAKKTVRTPNSLRRYRDRDVTGLDVDDCRYAREMRPRLRGNPAT